MINSNWIPMIEQLPPIEQDVLVYTSYDEMRVWNRNDTTCDEYFWEDEYGYYVEKNEAVAWMDLPNPPKKRRYNI